MCMLRTELYPVLSQPPKWCRPVPFPSMPIGSSYHSLYVCLKFNTVNLKVGKSLGFSSMWSCPEGLWPGSHLRLGHNH